MLTSITILNHAYLSSRKKAARQLERRTLDAVEVFVGVVQDEVEADLPGHLVRRAALLHPLQDLRAAWSLVCAAGYCLVISTPHTLHVCEIRSCQPDRAP